ncbi:MAG: membrane dipeptidase [Clostridium sp.]|nr:membrane dipeptidase [Clostridium sp.]
MIIVDAHCDTITKIMETGEALESNNCHVDLDRLRNLGSCVQFFAAFIDPTCGHAYALKRALQIIDEFYRQIDISSDNIMSCCNYNEIIKAIEKKRVAAILSIEGGEALQGDLGVLRMLYKLGVRSICLTWNFRNEIADGVRDKSSEGGLTSFGRDVVREMNKLGILIDVSHISERGFWDVVDHSCKPVIASHSNAKKLCSHDRNLTDQQILSIKDGGGVMGINLYPDFLTTTGEATLKDIIDHIEYVCSLIGPGYVGLGADFDGIERLPLGFQGVQDAAKILNELSRLNYSREDIEKIAGGNFLRVIKEVL